jgi:thymidylate synthase
MRLVMTAARNSLFFGRRVFSSNGRDQLERAVKRIEEDASTRRAMMQVFTPDDLFANSRDIPCISSLHLLSRDGRLHAVAHMRSQSALMVFPYDVFVLTMFHEICAVKAGLELGTFVHFCDSAHRYEDEVNLAHEVLTEDNAFSRQMLRMTSDAVNDIPKAIVAEQVVRETLTENPHHEFSLNSLDVGDYWRTMLNLLIVNWKTRAGIQPTLSEVQIAKDALSG